MPCPGGQKIHGVPATGRKRFWFLACSRKCAASVQTRAAACTGRAGGNYAGRVETGSSRHRRFPRIPGAAAPPRRSIILRIPPPRATPRRCKAPAGSAAGARTARTVFPDITRKPDCRRTQSPGGRRRPSRSRGRREPRRAKGVHESLACRERRVPRLVDHPASNLPAIGSVQEARPCARSVKTLPLNRRPSECPERPRMRAHRHCGIIGRAVRPNSTTLARPGVSSTRSSRAHSRPGGFRVRHPPAADRLFDGAPDFRSVEVLTTRLRGRCPSSRHSLTSTPSPAAHGRAASPRNKTPGATSRSFFKRMCTGMIIDRNIRRIGSKGSW